MLPRVEENWFTLYSLRLACGTLSKSDDGWDFRLARAIVAFSFGKGAYEETARAKLHDNLDINAITVKELLENHKQKKL